MAIKTFEGITHELTPFETARLVPLVVEKLQAHKGKLNAFSATGLKGYLLAQAKSNVDGARIRKMIEYIRHAHLLPNIAACSRGYYIAEKPEDMQEWLDSMRQRRNAMNVSIKAGEQALRTMTGYKQPNQHRTNQTAPGQYFLL